MKREETNQKIKAVGACQAEGTFTEAHGWTVRPGTRTIPAPLLNMTITTPQGFGFYDLAKDRQMILCDEGEWSGWLFYKHPDGQWVSLRKATDADIAAITKQLIAAGWPTKKWQQKPERDVRLSNSEIRRVADNSSPPNL